MRLRLYRDDEVAGPVRAIFEDVRDALGIPWTPHLIRALATYPAYLELVWPQLRPNLDQAGFALSSAFIADRALDFVRDFYEPTYSPEDALAAVDGDLQTLTRTLAGLRYGLPQVMLVAGALLEALKFKQAGGRGRPGQRERTHAEHLLRDAPITLLAEDEAGGRVAALYGEIRETMNLPYVPCEFQAIARWPDYLELAWGDLKHLIPHPWYRRRRRSLSYYSAGGTHYLAVPVQLGPEALENAGMTGEEIEGLRTLLQAFAATLPGELLNVCALEHAFHPRPPAIMY